ncbi:MAG: Rossmann-like and DUF2520 domain-containing protein [Bacteroidota bacterium]
MSKSPTLTIIGPGAVGSTLLLDAFESGCSIESVVLRSDRSPCPESLRSQAIPFSGLTGEDLGDWIFVTTPDDQIGRVAARLASLPAVNWHSRSVAHLSGGGASDLLNPLGERGARIASCHPLQTFVRGERSTGFRDIHLTLEGDKDFLTELRLFWERLGATTHNVTRDQKSQIHLSAVFLSNYLVSLASIAEDLLQEVIPDGNLHLLEPLLHRTVSNLVTQGLSESLTGPIERGDLETIREHLRLMEDASDRKVLYRHLGLVASRLAARKGQSPTVTEAVRDLLVGEKKP